MNLDLPPPLLDAIRNANALAVAGDGAAAEAEYERLLRAAGDDDYQAAAVLHMYAVIVDDPDRKMQLNIEALACAERSAGFPAALFASLYGNIGYSHLSSGDRDSARQWYEKAAAAASGLDDDEYGRLVREGIKKNLAALENAT